MDARAQMALTELVRGVVCRDIDELHARLDQIEERLAVPRSFHRDELQRQRRAAVLQARREGLSIAKIAGVLGLGTRTVSLILEEEQVDEPAQVRGVDGQLYAARHDWSRGNARRASA